MNEGSRGHHIFRSVETQTVSIGAHFAGTCGDSAGTEFGESPHLNLLLFSGIEGFAGTAGTLFYLSRIWIIATHMKKGHRMVCALRAHREPDPGFQSPQSPQIRLNN